MTYFNVIMQHSEKTFEAISHMQYDLFCKRNMVSRAIIGIGVILLGMANTSRWWSILLIAYGCYMFTSKYSSANHTAHKLSNHLKENNLPFPASRYLFVEDRMEIYALPDERPEDPLLYKDIYRLGEDYRYYYLFRNQYGGYMIPKEKLGEQAADFYAFVEKKTGLKFRSRTAPVLRFTKFFRGSNDKTNKI